MEPTQNNDAQFAKACAAVFPPSAARRLGAEMTAIAAELTADNARLNARIKELEDGRRERIATAAMQGWLSTEMGLVCVKECAAQHGIDEDESLARLSVVHADALIAALDAKGK